MLKTLSALSLLLAYVVADSNATTTGKPVDPDHKPNSKQKTKQKVKVAFKHIAVDSFNNVHAKVKNNIENNVKNNNGNKLNQKIANKVNNNLNDVAVIVKGGSQVSSLLHKKVSAVQDTTADVSGGAKSKQKLKQKVKVAFKHVAVDSFNKVNAKVKNNVENNVEKNSGNTANQFVSNKVKNNLNKVVVVVKDAPQISSVLQHLKKGSTYTHHKYNSALPATIKDLTGGPKSKLKTKQKAKVVYDHIAKDSFNQVNASVKNKINNNVEKNNGNKLNQKIANKVNNNLNKVVVVVDGAALKKSLKTHSKMVKAPVHNVEVMPVAEGKTDTPDGAGGVTKTKAAVGVLQHHIAQQSYNKINQKVSNNLENNVKGNAGNKLSQKLSNEVSNKLSNINVNIGGGDKDVLRKFRMFQKVHGNHTHDKNATMEATADQAVNPATAGKIFAVLLLILIVQMIIVVVVLYIIRHNKKTTRMLVDVMRKLEEGRCAPQSRSAHLLDGVVTA